MHPGPGVAAQPSEEEGVVSKTPESLGGAVRRGEGHLGRHLPDTPGAKEAGTGGAR